MLNHSKHIHLKLNKVILFSSDNAYGIYNDNKLNNGMRFRYDYEYLGVFTKEELKKKFPNVSIQKYNDCVEKYIKELLKVVYRKEKINILLNESIKM